MLKKLTTFTACLAVFGPLAAVGQKCPCAGNQQATVECKESWGIDGKCVVTDTNGGAKGVMYPPDYSEGYNLGVKLEVGGIGETS